jgi:hypothetical protein
MAKDQKVDDNCSFQPELYHTKERLEEIGADDRNLEEIVEDVANRLWEDGEDVANRLWEDGEEGTGRCGIRLKVIVLIGIIGMLIDMTLEDCTILKKMFTTKN